VSPAAAITVAAILIIAAITGITGLTLMLRSARRAAAYHATSAKHAFRDPAEAADPRGGQWAAALREAGEQWAAALREAGGRQTAQPARQVKDDPAGPGTVADPSGLASCRDEGQEELPRLPQRQAKPAARRRAGGPSAALAADLLGALRTWTPGVPAPEPLAPVAETRPQPALITWGGKTAQMLADELAREHLGAQR
jgi:hypothetical protein